jgi:hypothetical protein
MTMQWYSGTVQPKEANRKQCDDIILTWKIFLT